MQSRLGTSIPIAISVSLLLSSPLSAGGHLLKIVQAYGGDVSHPDAQYVQLQMYFGGHGHVAGNFISFFDAAGAEIGLPATFASNVPIELDQSTILIATSSAQTLFGIEADLQMPAQLNIAGGKVCYEWPAFEIDCFGWGSFAALPDASIGTPFNVGVGLPAGDAAKRDLSVSGSPTILESADDTNQSANDFDAANPAPRNNAAQDGIMNPNHVFLHGFEAGTPGGWSFVSPEE